MRALSGFLGVILLLAFFASAPSAMQLMVLVEEQSAEGDSIGMHRILLDKDYGINVEFQSDGDYGSIIWDRLKNIAYVVNLIELTYWTMDEEDAAKVKKMRRK